MSKERSDINTRINYRNALKKWADITYRDLRESAQKRKIKDSGDLIKSISHSINIMADVKEFTFKYYMHGAFVDMNVGKGRPIGAAKDEAQMDRILGIKRKRRSKKEYMWYTKPMYRHLQALAGIVASEYGDLAENAYRLPEIVEINF